MNTTSGIIS